jgi:DnaJ-class molecular chaperone
MVELNGYRRGDHIININVKIPTKVSDEEIGLLKKYAAGRGEDTGSGKSSTFSKIKDAFKK